jgi:hypothetical protein
MGVPLLELLRPDGVESASTDRVIVQFPTNTKIGCQREITRPGVANFCRRFAICVRAKHTSQLSEMTMISHKIQQIAAVAGALVALAGCTRMNQLGFDAKAAVGSVSLIDRCTDFMHRAFPNSAIEVTDSHVDTGTANAVVTVQGTRDDVPENSPYAHSVAVECRFDSGVLSAFRWTVGPIRSAGTAPAP